MSVPLSRDEVLRRFEDLLDRTMVSEDPPRGIDAEILAAVTTAGPEVIAEADQRYDLHALWSAMTALAQEVKLEGRAFKELNDTLGSQPGRIGDELRALYREREREVQRDAERRSRREILGALIDLRDRLSRGLESARANIKGNAVPRGWYQRLGVSLGLLKESDVSTGTVAALLKGYELGMERLDQTLDEFNARVIVCEGQPFNPHRMNAIDKQESIDVPEGTVLEVYRNGYEWNGEVFRPAQVKVACAPAGKNNE